MLMLHGIDTKGLRLAINICPASSHLRALLFSDTSLPIEHKLFSHVKLPIFLAQTMNQEA